jgi:predicted Zn finger-like uncharacterized protein
MILTCPSCGTQYVVKDGAIPPLGRQVRCAACKHSWHQDPEHVEEEETIAEAALIEPSSGPEAEERAYEAAALAADEAPAEVVADPGAYAGEDIGEAPPGYAAVVPPEDPEFSAVEEPGPPPGEAEWQALDSEAAAPVVEAPLDAGVAPADEPPADDEFSPFVFRDPNEREPRNRLVMILTVALLIAVVAAAFWFLAPAEWKQRLGIAGAGETPLQLMMTHSDRQKLASGNELLAVSGRVINPTDESQDVPPIQAQLRSSSGKLVYSWTIAPPARTLPPGASATFNSAEVNVPAGGDELTITLGSVKA